MTAFFIAAAAMAVAATVLLVRPLLKPAPDAAHDVSARPAALTAIVAALALPIVAAGLYAGISTYPWRGNGAETGAATAAPESLETAIARLEAKLAADPSNAEGWRMLGRSRVMTGEFTRAVTAYEHAIAIAGDDDRELALDLAEALVLANDPASQSRARQIIDGALVRDAGNAKALWYSGVIALRSDDAATARKRFAALLETNPPPQIREILETQLAALGGAEPAAGSAAAAKPPADATAVTPRGRTLRVAVSVDPALAAKVRAGIPVFVSARQPGIPGPPLAAVRLASENLPATVELSDANAMIEGRNLSSVDEVEVTARVAFGGTAMTTPGDLYGRARQRRSNGAPLTLVIDQEAR